MPDNPQPPASHPGPLPPQRQQQQQQQPQSPGGGQGADSALEVLRDWEKRRSAGLPADGSDAPSK